jgi:hypothetical protein
MKPRTDTKCVAWILSDCAAEVIASGSRFGGGFSLLLFLSCWPRTWPPLPLVGYLRAISATPSKPPRNPLRIERINRWSLGEEMPHELPCKTLYEKYVACTHTDHSCLLLRNMHAWCVRVTRYGTSG